MLATSGSFVLHLVVILVAAGIGRIFARKLNQPVILGELIAGMVLGNLGLFTVSGTVSDIANLGILLLLFSAGLEVNLDELRRLGRASFFVGLLGIISSFVLGVAVTLAFNFPLKVAVFIGACIMTTSIGVPVEILRELRLLQTRVGTLIIGASVTDDVIGIIAPVSYTHLTLPTKA